MGSFARSSDDSPVSSNWRSAAAKKKTLTGSDRFQSHFMSSNYPGDERRGHDEYLAPHRESDIPLDAFGMRLLLLPSSADRYYRQRTISIRENERPWLAGIKDAGQSFFTTEERFYPFKC